MESLHLTKHLLCPVVMVLRGPLTVCTLIIMLKVLGRQSLNGTKNKTLDLPYLKNEFV